MHRRLPVSESATPPSQFALFLKSLRRRIDPEVRELGSHARLPARVGKRVTQAELAEAIGVSREWYAVLESAPSTRTSTGLLDRLADALAVTPEERALMFELAVPEVGRVRLRDDSLAVLEGFSRLRSLSKRLWAATSIDEALVTATEQISEWFDGAVLVHTSRRLRCGLWECRAIDDKQDRTIASKLIRELEDEILPSPEAVDGLNLYPRLVSAGDVGTPDLQPLPVQREVRAVFARRRLSGFTFVKARVRSRGGLIAGFCVVHQLQHSYSASDRAVLGAFAELASLALS